MPLEKGSSSEVIGHNIKEMEAHGHPKGQAVAAALRTAYDFDDVMANTSITDNTLSFGGGYPVDNPSGPGDKLFTPAIAEANAVITDAGAYGRYVAQFLGQDGPLELNNGRCGRGVFS